MARKPREESIYRISVHTIGAYRYASTHPFTLDEKGNRKYRVQHWGTVTPENKFIPGKAYREATPELRSRLIFPPGWDLSETLKMARTPVSRSFSLSLEGEDKYFGALSRMEQSATQLGLVEDLYKALGGDGAWVDDLLTLACFPLLAGTSYDRFLPWRALSKTSSRGLQSDQEIDRCVCRVTQAQLDRFMELRRRRSHRPDYCAVDSVLRASPGGFVSDQKWGQKTERIHLQLQFDAAVYCIHGHLPLYYRSFPCAVSDSRGIGILRAELAKAGFPAPAVVTDRGYDKLRNLDRYIAEKLPMVMCVDSKQAFVAERIRALEFRGSRPLQMDADSRNARYFRQYPLNEGPYEGCRLNLFFNPARRAAELAQIDAEMTAQRSALEEILQYGLQLDDKRSARRSYYLYDLEFDVSGRGVKSFVPSERTIATLRTSAGFYANVTSALDIGPLKAADLYSLKYDQEKFFRKYRSLVNLPRSAVTSAEVRPGVTLLLFLMLILDAHRHQISKL